MVYSLPILARFVSGIMDRYPRPVAGAWFAVLGGAGASALFLRPALQRDFLTLGLFVGLPAVAAGVAGAVLGPYLVCDRIGSVKNYLIVVGWGGVTTLLAMVLFAPLFTGGYLLASWSGQPGYAHHVHLDLLPALAGQILVFSVLAVGPVAFPLGMVGAGLLLSVRRGCAHFSGRAD